MPVSEDTMAAGQSSGTVDRGPGSKSPYAELGVRADPSQPPTRTRRAVGTGPSRTVVPMPASSVRSDHDRCTPPAGVGRTTADTDADLSVGLASAMRTDRAASVPFLSGSERTTTSAVSGMTG